MPLAPLIATNTMRHWDFSLRHYDTMSSFPVHQGLCLCSLILFGDLYQYQSNSLLERPVGRSQQDVVQWELGEGIG